MTMQGVPISQCKGQWEVRGGSAESRLCPGRWGWCAGASRRSWEVNWAARRVTACLPKPFLEGGGL